MADSPFLFVGLGNPGKQYERTPHNLGFEIVARLSDSLAGSLGGPADWLHKFDALYTEHKLEGRKVFCIKPQTFMNLSGNSVREFVRFFKCDAEKDLVVVYDDVDLSPGRLRLLTGGGPGGHNGMKSMIEQLSTQQFMRLRVGVGRHPHMATEKHVLSKIANNVWMVYEGIFDKTISGLKMIPTVGIQKAMDFCNQKEKAEEK